MAERTASVSKNPGVSRARREPRHRVHREKKQLTAHEVGLAELQRAGIDLDGEDAVALLLAWKQEHALVQAAKEFERLATRWRRVVDDLDDLMFPDDRGVPHLAREEVVTGRRILSVLERWTERAQSMAAASAPHLKGKRDLPLEKLLAEASAPPWTPRLIAALLCAARIPGFGANFRSHVDQVRKARERLKRRTTGSKEARTIPRNAGP